MPTLVIANKCYSSWSMRPWVLMRELGIPFEEKLVPFGPTFSDPAWKARIAAYSPAAKVPVLVDGDIAVWETTAMFEHLAEAHPGVWPADKGARALARSIVGEMHAGFSALRSACPMNLGKRYPSRDRGEAAARDVARIEAMWRDARKRFGGAGPFLFGVYTAADAMYAPVVARFHTYGVPLADDTVLYCEAVRVSASYRAWREAALKESWIVDEDEVDETPAEVYRTIP